MTLQEIKDALAAGKTVCWANDGYEVRATPLKDGRTQYLVRCLANGHCTGLTRLDGVTLNEKPEQFYIK